MMGCFLKNFNHVFTFIFIGILFSCHKNEQYKDTKLTFEQRVDDLVSRMTLEEKVSQLCYESPEISRLQIPQYNWWNECLHGVGRAGVATVFPQAIGMASMWDTVAMNQIATAVSDEARAKYNQYIKQGKRGIYHGLTFWTPNINIFRDPRWGRGMETYGEDPYLTGELAVSYINGLQGNDPKYFKLIATAKHFVVHSGPETTRHHTDITPDPYDFIETYSPQFKKAVQQGKVYSIMCAYNGYKGTPCCGNIELSALLRNDWGFKGYIVSDCGAVKDFYSENGHDLVNTKAEAAAIAVKSGTDLNCGDSYPALVEAVAKGFITETEIDISLKRILLARMKLGMFDKQKDVPFSNIPYDVVDSEKHRNLALQTAQKSIVLLKNDKNILPFPKNVKKVAVIGPNANDIDVLLANYNGYPTSPVTPYIGIKNKLPNAVVEYAKGCNIADSVPFLTAIPSEVLFSDENKTNVGLKGEYFNNNHFSGNPKLVRIDPNIDFKWWTDGPGLGINGDEFSVKWSGILVPKESGDYAIGFEGYTEVNLWIEEKEVAHFKSVHHPNKRYKFLKLEAGKQYKIKLEYVQNQTDYSNVSLLWQKPQSNTLRDEAIQLAKKSDLVVLCMGLSPMLEGEEMKVKVEGFSGGDRTDIKLPKVQAELIKAISNLGKPTILVLLNGSALAFNWESENVPAIIEAWYPGQAGGKAIADIIFGDYNPSGRLPVTFYKSIDQIPAFDDYSMKGKTYRYFKGEPLYEFGFGLSYTSFKYDSLIVPRELNAGQNLPISVKVTNAGNIAGDEIVQLYISHPESENRVPIRALKKFTRLSLKPGETKTVNFTLMPEDIAVLNKDLQYIIQPENISISVGGKQPDKKSIESGKVIEGKVKLNVINQKYYFIK